MTLNRSHEKGSQWELAGYAPWQPCFLTDQIQLSYFGRSFSDHFNQIILNSDHQFNRRFFKPLLSR